MPRIASAIRSIRERNPDALVLTVDIGDHADRMTVETEGTAGQANRAVLNDCRYDAVVPGNNEGLTFEKAQLADLYAADNRFTAICCNMVDYETGRHVPWIRPYHIVDNGRVKVGLIGVTADFNDFYHDLGWHLLPPIETVAEWTARLRPQVDVLVVCSHLGLPRDREMAERIPGIDCILGGHTHHLLPEPLFIGDTMVCAAGKYGDYVGQAEFRLALPDRRIAARTARLHPVERFPADPGLADRIRRSREAARAALSEPVAELAVPLPNAWHEESPLGNLLARGLRAWTGAEAAIVNAGQILDSLPEGPITRERILALCPSPINPCRMKLTGAAIRRALEESLLDEYIRMPVKGFGFRGKVLGTLCLDGLEVVYDPSGPDRNKIVEITLGGEPLDDRRPVDVATIDMFTFGIGYLSLQRGEDVTYYLPEFIRDLLIRELRNPASVRDCFVPRWKKVRHIRTSG
jgi:2',3'-cyclic-nucleotide 2'-phosphodiesterase (5'-nucleotidase family)